MKKARLFILSLLGISAISFGVGISCYNAQPQSYIAYAESEPVDTDPADPVDDTDPATDEEPVEPINIDEETGGLSQIAKDTIAVIKEFLSQPLVIGGVSTTLGAVVIWVIAKLFGHYLHKRDTKYDKKIEELLGKIGVSDELIKTLEEEYDKLLEVVDEIIKNTKNVKVKKHLESLLNESKESVETKVEETKEEITNIAESEKTDLETEISSILEG